MALVVDTDVVSFLYKRDTRAELYRPHLNDPPFIISFMTLAELRSWMRHRRWRPTRRQRLERYLQRYQLIYANDELCEFWAQAPPAISEALLLPRQHGAGLNEFQSLLPAGPQARQPDPE